MLIKIELEIVEGKVFLNFIDWNTDRSIFTEIKGDEIYLFSKKEETSSSKISLSEWVALVQSAHLKT